VKLLESDEQRGALLLERAMPGRPLDVEWDEDVRVSLALMQKLWRPPPPAATFDRVTDWGASWERELHEVAGLARAAGEAEMTGAADQAVELLAALLVEPPDEALLHGDLHRLNVVSADRQRWLAIDPKGIIGERAFEAATFLRDPQVRLHELPDPHRALARRLDRSAEELGLERERIRAWALVQSLLVCFWWFRSGHVAEPWSDCARMLAEL
jgi:streptomycin 6-kinase